MFLGLINCMNQQHLEGPILGDAGRGAGGRGGSGLAVTRSIGPHRVAWKVAFVRFAFLETCSARREFLLAHPARSCVSHVFGIGSRRRELLPPGKAQKGEEGHVRGA